jgi:hypothetical protein
MVQARRVYVIQVWFVGKRLVLRLRGRHWSEPKHFRSWAELLLYLNVNLPQHPEDPFKNQWLLEPTSSLEKGGG